MIDVFLRDLAVAYDELKAEAPTRRVSAKPDLWTAPDRSAAPSKAGTGLAL
jgi:glutamate decarboxylase